MTRVVVARHNQTGDTGPARRASCRRVGVVDVVVVDVGVDDAAAVVVVVVAAAAAAAAVAAAAIAGSGGRRRFGAACRPSTASSGHCRRIQKSRACRSPDQR